MLAYRHAFHAGSHADVLKHLVLTQVLKHMNEKDKPYTLVDTHAGAGGYSLEGRYAHTRDEWAGGIGRLWSDPSGLPAALADYLALVRRFNGGEAGADRPASDSQVALVQYPGSPALAQLLMRPTDRLRLYELHPTDHKILSAFLGQRAHTHVGLSDGFAALARELPPPSRRGAVLIDPSYELKTDYARVVAAVREALQRFATGTVMVWLPQLQLIEAVQAPKRLAGAAAQAPRGWLHARLQLQPARADGFGMTGSSMFIVNPPWGLRDTLAECLPMLVERLGQYPGASHGLDGPG